VGGYASRSSPRPDPEHPAATPRSTHLALVGPTASGKSELAVEVARALGDVEIVSVDSMQVYRGFDVGTAKPSPAIRAEIAHHLVDVADPAEEWSVARFQAAARAAVAGVEARGHRALLVGGTGLYVRAVLDPLDFPPEDRALRATLEQRGATPDGQAALYAELTARDAATAARIEPANVRRTARALEVLELTGRPFSSFGAGLDRFGDAVFPVRLAGVWLPRACVAERIDRRIDLMFAEGMVEEVDRLAAAGPWSRTAAQAIGYHEILAARRGGLASLDAARDAIAARTRSFARRQRMWFRRDPRITWYATSGNPGSLLPALLADWIT
jgi:tRNA dimethylallyltransferase